MPDKASPKVNQWCDTAVQWGDTNAQNHIGQESAAQFKAARPHTVTGTDERAPKVQSETLIAAANL